MDLFPVGVSSLAPKALEDFLHPNTNHAITHNCGETKCNIELNNGIYTKSGLKFLHLNIHYLFTKFDEVENLISKHQDIDMLCFCETFLNESFSNNVFMLDFYLIIFYCIFKHSCIQTE